MKQVRKQNRIWVLALAVLVMGALLCACGAAEEQPTVKENYAFFINGKSVSAGEDMSTVLADIGQPVSYFEAESCAFEGLDKTYTYTGFVITTRPEGEKDFVNSIVLTSDQYTTAEGIFLGNTAEQVKAAYGEPISGGSTLLDYSKGDTCLNFILQEDRVISIEYVEK